MRLDLTVLRRLATVLALAAAVLAPLLWPLAARAQLPGARDPAGNPIDSTTIYCMGADGRARPCGGSSRPISTFVMPGTGQTGGIVLFRVVTQTGATPIVVKTTFGRLYSFNLCNSAGAARYVRFYDTADPVVVGTTPVAAGAITVAAGTCQQFSTSFGLSFNNGIALSVTAANGDTDASPVTAGDVSGFLGYQ